jgi:hypothetical protein
MTKNESAFSQRIDEVFSVLNGSGAHACYCPRSVDGGCQCALKDEYITEAKATIAQAVSGQSTLLFKTYTGEVIRLCSDCPQSFRHGRWEISQCSGQDGCAAQREILNNNPATLDGGEDD